MKNAWTRPLKPVSAPPGLSRRDSNKPGTKSTSKSNNNNNANHDVMRERFLHLTLSLVGQTVTLYLIDGGVIDGVLHTFTPFKMPMPRGRGKNSQKEDHSNKYVIKAATTTYPNDNNGKESKSNQAQEPTPGETLIVPAEKVAQLLVKSIRLEQQQPHQQQQNNSSGDAFVTDTDISKGGKTVNDDLVMASSAWVTAGDGNDNALGGNSGGGLGGSGGPNGGNGSNNNHTGRKGLFGTKTPGGGGATNGEETLRGGIGEWDQFKANEKFGVKATFDENLYTTSLDKNSVDRNKIMKAERLAREIEGQTSTNMHLQEERGHTLEGDYDEEDLYSGVLVTGNNGNDIGEEEIKQKERTKLVLKPRSADSKKDSGDTSAKKDNPGSKENIEQGKEEDKSSKTGSAAVENTDGDAPGTSPKKMAWAAVVAKADPTKPGSSPAKDAKKDEAPADATVTDNAQEKKTEKASDSKATDDKLVEETAKLEIKAGDGGSSSDTKKDDEKAPTTTATEKPKPKSKLNPSAKTFSFNPSAKSFTPSFAAPAPAAQQAQAPPTEQPQHHIGMPAAAIQPAHYMQYPQMQPPGGMQVPVGAHAPMMYQAFHPQMRYGQGAGAPPPYPGMMQGQPQQQPPPAGGMPPGQVPGQAPSAPVSAEGTPIPGQKTVELSSPEGEDGGTSAAGSGESSPSNAPQNAEKGEEDQTSQSQAQMQKPQQPQPGSNQPPGQGPPMPGQMGYGGPGYYPGGMPMHGGRGPVQHQQHQQHYHPQMVGGPQQIPVVPGRNYVYGVPPQHMHQHQHQHQHQGNMPQYNQMRGGPGGYPSGPPYMQGGYNPRPMDDDMGGGSGGGGYRGGRGGRGGRGRRGGRGGRGGGRGKYNSNYNNRDGNNGNHHSNHQQQHGPSENSDASNIPQEKNGNE